MSELPVYRTRKDQWGNIVALGGEFGVISHDDAILSIERNIDLYYVPLEEGAGSIVEVAVGPLGKYLRSQWDGQGRNNLVDLPDC
ncbi:MAG: DUF3892 domain-containing protein [Salinibacterium sp.]|nr:DUF3892 domain-containing protein [Salinibacterium sp.]